MNANNNNSPLLEDQQNPTTVPLRTIDSIWQEYGFKKMTILIIIAISFGIVADGMEMTLMGLFVIPLSKYYQLKDFNLQLISSILFLGVAIGSYISGHLSKEYSRKKSISVSYIVLFISHLGWSFSLNYYFFAVFRFIIGVALGVIIPISLNLWSEFLPNSNRAFLLTSIWSFFAIGQGWQGWTMLIGMPNLEVENMKYVLAVLSGIIILAGIWNEYYVLESPRNWISLYDYDKSFVILNMWLDESKQLTREEKDNIIKTNNNGVSIEEATLTNQASVDDLFKEELYWLTLLQIGIMFILSFLFYGILLISTLSMQEINNHLIKELEETVKHSQPKLTYLSAIAEGTLEFQGEISEIISDNYTMNTTNVNITSRDIKEMKYQKNRKIIIDQIIIAFFSTPGNIIGGYLCDNPNFGRKRIIYLGFWIAGICSLLIVIKQNYFTLLLSWYLFFVNISFNVSLTYVVEIYPTKWRDISSGFLFGCLRISGFFSQYVYWLFHARHYLLPYIINFLWGGIAVILTMKLPFEPMNLPFDCNYKAIQVDEDNEEFQEKHN